MSATATLDELGQRLIALGQAMQSPETSFAKLAELAQACGTRLHVRLVPEDPLPASQENHKQGRNPAADQP